MRRVASIAIVALTSLACDPRARWVAELDRVHAEADARAAAFALPVVAADLAPAEPSESIGQARLFVTPLSITFDATPIMPREAPTDADALAALPQLVELAPVERDRLADAPRAPDDGESHGLVVLAAPDVQAASLRATLDERIEPALLEVRAPRGLAHVRLRHGPLSCGTDDPSRADVEAGDCAPGVFLDVRRGEVAVWATCGATTECAGPDGARGVPLADGARHFADVDGRADIAAILACFGPSSPSAPNAYAELTVDWGVDVARFASIAAALEAGGFHGVSLCGGHLGWVEIAGAPAWPPPALDTAHFVGGHVWGQRPMPDLEPETVSEPREVRGDASPIARWLHARAPFLTSATGIDASAVYVRGRDADGRDIVVLAATQRGGTREPARGVSILVDGERALTIGPVHPATDEDAIALLRGQLLIDAPAASWAPSAVDSACGVPGPTPPPATEPIGPALQRVVASEDCWNWTLYEARFDAAGAPTTRSMSL